MMGRSSQNESQGGVGWLVSGWGPQITLVPEDGSGGGGVASAGESGAAGASVGPSDGAGSGDSSPASPSLSDDTGSSTPAEEDFSSISDLIGMDDGEAVTAERALPAAVVPPVTTATPAATPVVQPPSVTPAPAAATPAAPTAVPPATPAPGAPAAAVQPVSPAPEGATTSTPPPQTLVEMIDAGRERLIEGLSQERFRLTAKEAELFEQQDPGFVPLVASRVYVETMRSAAALVEQSLPGMIHLALQAQKVQTSADEEFYGANDDLKPFRKEVFEASKVLRALNPTMPKAEFIGHLAAHVRALKSLPARAAAGAAPVVAAAPPLGGARSGVPAAFSPATGVVPGGALPNGGSNEWETFNELFDQDV